MMELEARLLRGCTAGAMRRLALLRALPVGINRNLAVLALHRLVEQGLLDRPAKGVYALTEPGRLALGAADRKGVTPDDAAPHRPGRRRRRSRMCQRS